MRPASQKSSMRLIGGINFHSRNARVFFTGRLSNRPVYGRIGKQSECRALAFEYRRAPSLVPVHSGAGMSDVVFI